MNYFANKPFICILVLCFMAVGLSAGEPTAYKNEELGLSISYPTQWNIEENELGVIISSIPDFFEFEEEGAGIMIFIAPVENMSGDVIPQSNEDVWKALKENDETLEEKSLTTIEWFKKQWLAVEFYEGSDDCNGVFYFLLENDLVYIVGCIYHPPAAENSYKDIIEKIRESIAYSELAEK